ncbi:MAG: 4Fe-4S dicluster domain-containing protein [Candidatus Marinimicrobia bacterium]|nr:4Fe-4S dicluster domain-containing protein [Candidatus Neomarinimicrobiota bacterium]
MNNYNLLLQNIPDFVAHLQAYGEVHAPHQKGENSFSFEQVTDPSKVVLDYARTLQSIRKYFLPPTERLLNYSLIDNTFTKVAIKNNHRIFLGVHSYDMKAVLKLDFNFSNRTPEINYLKRRENCTFIGVSFEPDDYHFSRSVGITVEDTEGFDLFLDRHENGYTVQVLTERGAKITKDFTVWGEALEIPEISRQFKNKIKFNYNRLPEVMEQSWNSPVWEEVAQRCVGCGTCNLVCPTCYCFNMVDNVDLKLIDGSRDRHWDGCLLSSFAAVAGGENFREKLASRQRHRIYRKFKYITDKTGDPWCVGCSRCTAYCTAGISIVEIVNRLSDEFEQTHLRKSSAPTEHKLQGVSL